MTDRHDRPAIRCKGTSSRTGKPCRNWAMHGQAVCHAHGGKAPRSKAAAAKRLAVQAARRRLDIPDHVDPRDALTRELATTVAWVRWLGSQVDAVDDTAMIWGQTKSVDKLPAPEVTLEAKPSIWWAMYIEQRKHLIEVAKAAHACGVEDRRVEIEMRTAEILVQVVTGMVADLGHDLEDPATKATVVGWLRKAEAIEATVQ